MGAGRPFVLSELPVFKELTENQGAYFCPTDSAAIAQAIESVLSSQSEQQRLCSYGRSRVGDFDYGQLARQLSQIYRQMVGPVD